MRRALGALAACLVLSACTPELAALVAWSEQQEADAAAAGYPCAIYADDLAWRGLPAHFMWVIQRESMCQPWAVNHSSGALGLTQILPMWLPSLCGAGIACTRDDLLMPEANLDAAAYVFAIQGPQAWSQTWG